MFDNNYFDLNKELILFEYKNKDCHIKIKYNQMQDFMNQKTFNKISFILSNNKINIIIEKENDKNKLVKTFDLKMDSIKKFYLMKNFYGQIKKITINYTKQNINEIFEPFLLNDNGYLYKLKNSKKIMIMT